MKTNKQNKIEKLGSRSAITSTETTNTSTKPEAKPDTRLPIDAALRADNRKLDTQTVCGKLREILPDVASKAQLVGSWVWVQFTDRPAAEVRQQLSQLGFHWNGTRQVWQHPCGKFSLGSKSDPRDTYTSTPAIEAYN